MEHPEHFDPNRLFDLLIHRFGLDDDAALAHALHIDPYLIARIRYGQHELDPTVLIRVNETFDINMRELRRIMGDRRADCRLNDVLPHPVSRDKEVVHEKGDNAEREKLRRSIENDDAGIPNFVQWG